MTEHEFQQLPLAERLAMPHDDLMNIVLKTHDELTENLTMEGWEFVAEHRVPDDSAEPWADMLTEVWRRVIGDVVEWCEIFRGEPPPSEPDRCWLMAPSPIDPRLIVD